MNIPCHLLTRRYSVLSRVGPGRLPDGLDLSKPLNLDFIKFFQQSLDFLKTFFQEGIMKWLSD